jgi:uncharacterized membrane protein YfcA
MNIAGYLASVFIGLALGLIGGGGSILTVPVLVYLFGIDAVPATAYSLYIVGATSVVGSLSYLKKGLVNIRTAVLFGIPSIAGIFITRNWLIPAIPQEIFTTGNFTVTKDILLMLLFAVMMVFASYSMIRKDSQSPKGNIGREPPKYPQLFMQGILVGIITGLIGAGGGFLIIPALVNLLKLPMKTAVGTSLVIISTNSLMGFLFSLPHIAVQWGFLTSIVIIAVIGILAGSFFVKKINSKKLKPAFGWFVLVMGVYILIKETLLK